MERVAVTPGNRHDGCCGALALPGATWAEKSGIFVNRQGRLQEFRQAIARLGNAREDWRVLADLGTARGAGDPPASLRAVRAAAGTDLGLELIKLPALGLVPAGAGAPETGGDA